MDGTEQDAHGQERKEGGSSAMLRDGSDLSGEFQIYLSLKADDPGPHQAHSMTIQASAR
jgi:hypothetical protein